MTLSTTPFFSHLELAHHYWKLLLKPGDCAIDATCGNGKDTLLLSKYILIQHSGLVIGLDIQKKAIENTLHILKKELTKPQLERVHLFQQSHLDFPKIALEQSIQLIVYNLGYLPGGDKAITTQTQTTLESVDQAMKLIAPQGVVSITCYPGHQAGAEEEKALIQMAARLNPDLWHVLHHRRLNKISSPSLIFIQRK